MRSMDSFLIVVTSAIRDAPVHLPSGGNVYSSAHSSVVRIR
jgi:hypothetical protein